MVPWMGQRVGGRTMRVLVTVKAYPTVGQSDGEAVCVAGVRLDGDEPSWIRLWPVGFRELSATEQFRKWQVIEVEASRSTKDRRPESFRPNLSTLQPLEDIKSLQNWKRRREALGGLLGQTTLCDLMRVQEQPNAPSLGLVKVRPGATAEIVDGPIWSPDKESLAQFHAAPNLFRHKALPPLKPPAYQVRYAWRCLDAHCPGHNHASCDWEVGAAALNWQRRYPDVRPHLLNNFGDGIIGDGKDTYFFVVNQHQRPRSFLVLGAFYPKALNVQR